jgi:hypothetical protein
MTEGSAEASHNCAGQHPAPAGYAARIRRLRSLDRIGFYFPTCLIASASDQGPAHRGASADVVFSVADIEPLQRAPLWGWSRAGFGK